jgi:YfiH family protein
MSAIDLPGGGRALFSDRAHGNLSSVGGEGAEHGFDARERLRRLIGAERLVRGHQVHGTLVNRVLEPPAGETPAEHRPAEHADGQATALPRIATLVLGADCMPVALGCHGAVAMIHAGWRGMAAGVLEEGVRAVRDLGGDGPIVAVAGPAAGICCYEVGPEVHAAFAGAHAHGRHIDLRAIAHERLLAAGVMEVRDVEACTICDERFFSHRREGERAGRQGGVAWLS